MIIDRSRTSYSHQGTAATATMNVPRGPRERQGLALDYLVRVYLRDPSDEIHGGNEYVGAGGSH